MLFLIIIWSALNVYAYLIKVIYLNMSLKFCTIKNVAMILKNFWNDTSKKHLLLMTIVW